MRTTGTFLAIALLIAGLAGCIGPATDDAPNDPDGDEQDQEAPQALEAAGCHEQVGIFPMEKESVDPYMPPGFKPSPAMPPDVYQDEDPSEQSATLLVVGFACTQPEGLALFFPFVPVMPPGEHQVEDVYYHAVALPCIADAATVSTLAAWNIPCQVGDVIIQEQAQTPAGALWELEAEGPNVTIEFLGDAPASKTAAGPEWIRVFHALDQEVCAVTDSRVEVHEHWQFGATTLEVQGTPSFPTPTQPGLASLGMPMFAMSWAPIEATDPGYVPITATCA